MNSLIRPVLVAGLASVLAVCFFGLPFVCSPVDVSAFQRGEEQEQLRRATNRRLEARHYMVRAVIERRCTLEEAIAQLQELDHEWPDYSASRSKVPVSREEWSYRFLRAEVEEALQDRPEELAAVLRRLEEDYRQLQAGRRTPGTAATERSGPGRVLERKEKGGR